MNSGRTYKCGNRSSKFRFLKGTQVVEVFCHPNIGLESYVKTMALNFRFQGIQHRSANGVPYSNAVCNQELIVSGAIVRFTEETECVGPQSESGLS